MWPSVPPSSDCVLQEKQEIIFLWETGSLRKPLAWCLELVGTLQIHPQSGQDLPFMDRGFFWWPWTVDCVFFCLANCLRAWSFCYKSDSWSRRGPKPPAASLGLTHSQPLAFLTWPLFLPPPPPPSVTVTSSRMFLMISGLGRLEGCSRD